MALLQAPAQGGGSPGLLMVVQFAALIGIFYFLLIRPQRKAAKRHQEVLAALKRGDQVMTEGGILGEVVHLAEDRVTVKSGESRFVVARGKISRVINATEKAAAS
jgi:preprotein translocase subunit YajC